MKVPAIEQSEKHADEKDEEEMLENLRAQGVSVQLSSGGDYKVCVQCCVPGALVSLASVAVESRPCPAFFRSTSRSLPSVDRAELRQM